MRVEQIGDTFVLDETVKLVSKGTNRGRPSYPWERFYLEVAALLHQNSLPQKKEAAIQYFQTWFWDELRVRPSRAAIGEKLTPYYEKFMRRDGQKTLG